MVDASAPVSTALGSALQPCRFLLRVHRPRRHGRHVDSVAAIQLELDWLTALRAETDLAVPEPQSALDGRLVDHGVVRRCRRAALLFPAAVDARPAVRGIARDRSTYDDSAAPWLSSTTTLTGGRRPTGSSAPGGTGRRSSATPWSTAASTAAAVWDLLPVDLRRMFDEVATRVGTCMAQLGTDRETFGLIHADLHLDNTLFAAGEARLIDFDDCGFGFRMYDVAVALWELRHRGDYAAFRDALVDGYTEHRELADEQLDHLDVAHRGAAGRVRALVRRKLADVQPPGFATSSTMSSLPSAARSTRSPERASDARLLLDALELEELLEALHAVLAARCPIACSRRTARCGLKRRR